MRQAWRFRRTWTTRAGSSSTRRSRSSAWTANLAAKVRGVRPAGCFFVFFFYLFCVVFLLGLIEDCFVLVYDCCANFFWFSFVGWFCLTFIIFPVTYMTSQRYHTIVYHASLATIPVTYCARLYTSSLFTSSEASGGRGERDSEVKE